MAVYPGIRLQVERVGDKARLLLRYPHSAQEAGCEVAQRLERNKTISRGTSELFPFRGRFAGIGIWLADAARGTDGSAASWQAARASRLARQNMDRLSPSIPARFAGHRGCTKAQAALEEGGSLISESHASPDEKHRDRPEGTPCASTSRRSIFFSVYLKSFTRAAEREHIAPSAVSKRIHDSNSTSKPRCSVAIPRGMSPTRGWRGAGARHVKSCSRTSTGWRRSPSPAAGLKGQVRIHAHSSAVVQYLPQDISSFIRQHPDVRVDLREETTLAVLQSVSDGVADIGIFGGNVEAPSGIRVLDYRRDHSSRCCRPGIRSRNSNPHVPEIQDADHISLETGSSLQISWRMRRPQEAPAFRSRSK